MSDFGDFDPDDAYDTAAPDPEQVAIKLHALRRFRGLDDGREWGELLDGERFNRLAVVRDLLDWLRRQGGIE